MKWHIRDINPAGNSTLRSAHDPFILFVFSRVNWSSLLFTVKSTEVRVIIIRSCSIQQSCCCHGYPQLDVPRAQIENNSWLYLENAVVRVWANTCQLTSRHFLCAPRYNGDGMNGSADVIMCCSCFTHFVFFVPFLLFIQGCTSQLC